MRFKKKKGKLFKIFEIIFIINNSIIYFKLKILIDIYFILFFKNRVKFEETVLQTIDDTCKKLTRFIQEDNFIDEE